jgi:hypothetical protein
MIKQHRQWMIRSYAVALTFLETRFIIGIFGLDQPFDWANVETVVWACTAVSLLVGELANQVYELRTPGPCLRENWPLAARALRPRYFPHLYSNSFKGLQSSIDNGG